MGRGTGRRPSKTERPSRAERPEKPVERKFSRGSMDGSATGPKRPSFADPPARTSAHRKLRKAKTKILASRAFSDAGRQRRQRRESQSTDLLAAPAVDAEKEMALVAEAQKLGLDTTFSSLDERALDGAPRAREVALPAHALGLLQVTLHKSSSCLRVDRTRCWPCQEDKQRGAP